MSEQLPIIHVEVILKATPGILIRTDMIQQQLPQYLHDCYLYFPLHSEVKNFNDFKFASVITQIHFREVEGPHGHGHKYLERSKCQLRVHTHRANETTSPDAPSNASIDENQVEGLIKIRGLPARESGDKRFEKYIVFQDDMQYDLLHLITNTAMSTIILLHGPPGTGKTSLCRAIVEKAAFRLAHMYASANLIEVNSTGLLDHALGGSQTQVARVFDKVREIAEDELALCFILFNEVESIAGNRSTELARGHAEVMRATNRLLSALDELRNRSNVVVLCTTNMVETLDPAFVSRMHVVKQILLPGPEARYHILRQSLQALVESETIDADNDRPAILVDYKPAPEFDMAWHTFQLPTPVAPAPGLHYKQLIAQSNPISDYKQAHSLLGCGMSCLTTDVLLLAMMSEGLDGRNLTIMPGAAVSTVGAKAVPRDRAFVAIYDAFRQSLADKAQEE
ncbi:ATPase-like protein 7 [Elsinoe fawcettii]|nr:ATPase-like protein 7 [Elsinoe fawcettii]